MPPVLALRRPALRDVARLGAILVGFYVLFNFAAYVALGGSLQAILVGAIGLIPVALYVALRWPIVFPFGIYLVLVPFDALLRTSGGTGATITKYAAYAVIAAFIARIVLSRQAFLPPRSWFAWAAFAFMTFASLGWSVYIDQTVGVLQIFGALFGLYTLAALYPVDVRDVLRLRSILELAGATIGTYGVVAYAGGQQRLAATRLSLTEGHLHADPNHYAAFFVIPIALLGARILEDRRLLVRIPATMALALCVVNVFLSGSRGGFVGVVVAIVYLAIRARRPLGAAVIALGLLAVSFTIPNVWQRFADPTQGGASGRNDLWTVGLHAFPHYWFIGSGFATYELVYNDFVLQSYQHYFQGWTRPSHNLIIGTAVELGIVGLALVLTAWLGTIRETWSVPRDHPLAAVAYGAEAACLGLFVCALTIDMLWYKYLWVAMMLAVMTANAIRPRLLWASARTALVKPPEPAALAAARARALARF